MKSFGRRQAYSGFLAGWLLLAGSGAHKVQALQPDELVLVCNADMPESLDLAMYYAKVRKVPNGRICSLHLGPRILDEISAADYSGRIREPIRAFLNERQLTRRIRCLVTFHGLPIRVGDVLETPEQRKALSGLESQFVALLDELDRETLQIENIGETSPRKPSPRKPTLQDYGAFLRRYVEMKKAAQGRLSRATTQADTAANYQKFVGLIQELEGAATVVAQIQINGGSPDDEPHKRLAAMRENVRQAEAEISANIGKSVTDSSREDLRKLVRQYHGLLGLLGMIDSDIQYLRTQETRAAVDSELALLWYESYPKYRWIPSTLSWTNRANPTLHQQMSPPFWKTRVMMVSRLDASGPKVVRRMIDDAIAAETKGLSGKIYLDARGMQKDDQLSQYDRNLRDLELLVTRNTRLPVVLNNKAEVFAPGACPDTMLYCGWYSLRHYVDSFTFVPGAIAWHMASFEAITLSEPGESGWCKNLLDHGAAVTIGPVAEPYLHAFPLPREFTGLLLTGRFTLVECYAYTQNLNSWMMMLLGDPLYQPFVKKPVLKIEQVFAEKDIPPEFHAGATLPAGDPASLPAPATSGPAAH